MRQGFRELREFSSDLATDAFRVLKAPRFWLCLIVWFTACGIISQMPVIPTAKWFAALIMGLAVAIVINQFHTVAEFFDPKEPLNLGNYLAFGWWLVAWYVMFALGWVFIYNSFDRPDWLSRSPVPNIIRLWVAASFAIILFAPLFVRDTSLVIRVTHARPRAMIGTVLVVTAVTLLLSSFAG